MLQTYKMSTHADDEPTGRVRRKTSLPSRYGDYDLTGFVLPTLHPEPVSPYTQIPSNLSDEEGAMAFKLPQIPDDEYHSSEEWSDNDPGRSENALLKQRNRNLRYANENMLHTVQVMQMERDALKQTNQQYGQELSQLKWQMQQLQIQASQLRPVAQPQLKKNPFLHRAKEKTCSQLREVLSLCLHHVPEETASQVRNNLQLWQQFLETKFTLPITCQVLSHSVRGSQRRKKATTKDVVIILHTTRSRQTLPLMILPGVTKCPIAHRDKCLNSDQSPCTKALLPPYQTLYIQTQESFHV